MALHADKSAVKIQRAAKHIEEAIEILRESPPFRYVVETDTVALQRSTLPKVNVAAQDQLASVCGDVAGNLRAALDYTYWAIVSPFAKNEREENAIQFPFSKTAARLEEAVKNRLAHRVSDKFFRALMELRPHREEGGNEMLALIDMLAQPDKHRTLTPIADYADVDGALVQKQVPDYCGAGIIAPPGSLKRHVVWQVLSVHGLDLGTVVPPTMTVFEKKIDIPMKVVLPVGTGGDSKPLIPTLNALLDTAKETIGIIRDAAS